MYYYWDYVGGNEVIKVVMGVCIVGLFYDVDCIFGIDYEVVDGNIVELGCFWVEVIFMFGYMCGYICFFFLSEKLVFVGDIMFVLGCGCLFEGMLVEMWYSFNCLVDLLDEIKVYCVYEYIVVNVVFVFSVDLDNIDL